MRYRDYSPTEPICKDLDKAISTLEEIRDNNSSLREWGNTLYREKEELEDKISTLQSQIDALKEELQSFLDQPAGEE